MSTYDHEVVEQPDRRAFLGPPDPSATYTGPGMGRLSDGRAGFLQTWIVLLFAVSIHTTGSQFLPRSIVVSPDSHGSLFLVFRGPVSEAITVPRRLHT